MQGSGLSQGLAGCDIWAENQAKGQQHPYRTQSSLKIHKSVLLECATQKKRDGRKDNKLIE